nr:hypothetical protein SDXFZFDS_SDXFZFDS_CDS_0005 [Microvirus sp.]
MRLFGLWNKFINDGLHRCDCCGCVMFKVDEMVKATLNEPDEPSPNEIAITPSMVKGFKAP